MVPRLGASWGVAGKRANGCVVRAVPVDLGEEGTPLRQVGCGASSSPFCSRFAFHGPVRDINNRRIFRVGFCWALGVCLSCRVDAQLSGGILTVNEGHLAIGISNLLCKLCSSKKKSFQKHQNHVVSHKKTLSQPFRTLL